eukprot:CAMPEP_0181062816 /NCGR_PEP_ID=MMETSP1070-20121207/23286_1 /TAXON_ID=265543 /ORGANISM="Minutocellus polymorphus, Strain NH13" /LENGTH=62 /DNA_ID=CAMNT_0023142923 /DNA_START=49 /DNA_END=233 /DNA_ORIENTATION=-
MTGEQQDIPESGGSGGGNGRRSIFSPKERSQVQTSTDSGRDLTRSARVRAVRLGGNTAAAVA